MRGLPNNAGEGDWCKSVRANVPEHGGGISTLPSPRANLSDLLRSADAAVVAGDSHAARRFIREAAERYAAPRAADDLEDGEGGAR
ncbi:MAG: hypothetical protein RLZZ450_5266 [Pseudomonadota bacterium]